MADLILRQAGTHDADRIRSLLERSDLPTSDLETARPLFVVAVGADRIIGAGALQRFGPTALLRSVVVESDSRGTGVGAALVKELERHATALGITALVLLTETAQAFFERQGYRIIERSAVPTEVQQCAEFRSLCPASATCMKKALTQP